MATPARTDVVTSIFRLTDKAAARDRIFRVVQYGSRFVYWVLEQSAASSELVQKLKDLESSISLARKMFRLGKSVDHIRGAMQTIHLANPVLRVLITLGKLSRGFYLLFDHLIWAQKMRLVNVDIDYWSKYAYRFWIFAILLGLLRDLYEIAVALQTERNRLKQYSMSGKPPPGGQVVASMVQNNPALMVDVVKNGMDMLLPTSRLDIFYIPSGIVGLVGVISSIAALMALYDDRLKLKFS